MRPMLLLLLLQPDCPEVLPPSNPLATIELIQLSCELQLYSPDTFWTNAFPTEFNCVHRAFHELADCPPLSDANQLPPYAFASAVLDFNCQFRDQLDLRAWTHPHRWDEFQAIRDEAGRLRTTWEYALEASFARGSWLGRRKALRELKRTLGDEDFYAGKMPGWVPVERMRAMR